MSVMEDDLNQMVSRGYVTSISYGSLLHKYDDESMELAKLLEKNQKVRFDSFCIITKREKARSFLAKWIPLKYSDSEYCKAVSKDGTTDLYCVYDGSLKNYEVVFGYNEDEIKMIADAGYDLCLIFKIKNYRTDGYLKEMERIIREYPVKYINIKDDARHPEKEEEAEKHYKGISALIKKYDLALVVTENPDQLGNQPATGYDHIFDENRAHVMRSYETYDSSAMDDNGYKFRYYQFLNSTIDRNIRFITVTQIMSEKKNPDMLRKDTLKATGAYMDEIHRLGYRTDGDVPNFNYPDPGRWPYAAAGVLMVLMLLTMVALLSERRTTGRTLFMLIASVISLPVSLFVIPEQYLKLFSTLWAALLPSFAVVAMLFLYKKLQDKLPALPLALVLMLAVILMMLLGGLVQSAQLSGISYYLNNIYFRGIKVSLFLPLIVGAVAYYILFLHNDRNAYADIKRVITAEIKVYWVIIAALLGGIAFYYILRSGNVNSISSFEQSLRLRVTDAFVARPRTKEFLIGYPALMLFTYYMKKGCKPLGWVLAVGSSILTASVSNTFCHVFTGMGTLYMRVLNGFIIGIFTSLAVYLLNLLVYAVLSRLIHTFNLRAADQKE